MLPFDRDEFVQFLLAARQYTVGAAATSLVPDAQQVEYRQGIWLHRTTTLGTAAVVGQEIVYRQDHPVWGMGYAGGVLDLGDDPAQMEQVYAFLRAALLRATPMRPYRGPATWREGDYVYRDQSQGTLRGFWGDERITYRARKVYELHYSGGIVR